MNKNYYKFTDYHLEPGGLLKLDFIVDFIKRKFKDKKIAILDIGCGSGNIALPLAYLGYQVVAIDENQEALDIIKKKNNFSNLILANEQFGDYKSDDNFDLIIMSEFIEHTIDPEKALLKAKNLLTENGYLILTVPNGRSFEELIRRLFLSNSILIKLKKILKKKFIGSEIQTPAQSPHLHFWSLKQIKRLLVANGFDAKWILTYTSWVKELYYIIGRLFIKRGSFIFRLINKLDGFFPRILPVKLGSNWIIVTKKYD